MANEYRGDAGIIIGEKPFTLCFRWQQFAKLEDLFKVKGWIAASGRCDLHVTDRTAAQELALLRLLLETHHPEYGDQSKVSDDAGGNLLSEMTRDSFLEELNVCLALFSGGQKAGEQVRRKIALIRDGNEAELERFEAETRAELAKSGPKAPATST